MKRSFIPVLLILLLAGCGNKYESVSPKKVSLTEAIYASGTVKPVDGYKVFSTVSGILVKRLVKEGQLVQPGELLAVVDSRVVDINLNNAADQLALAQKNAEANSPQLAELRKAIQLARTRWEVDSANLHRYQELLRQQSVTRAQYEQIQVQSELSRQTLRQAQDRLESALDRARIERDNAASRYQLLRNQRGDFEIRSRIAGKVYLCNVEEGELVAPQTPLMLLGKPDDFVIELIIDEADINRAYIGQPCFVQLDNYPDSTFSAKISRIYPTLDVRTRSFRVDATFDNPPTKLFNGVSAEANIVVRKKDGAYALPLSYLQGKDTVLVKEGGNYVPRHIQTGIRTLEWVELVGGIANNQEVYRVKVVK